jgi:hypothetical protein
MTRVPEFGMKIHEGRVLIDASTPEGARALTQGDDRASMEFALLVFCKSVEEGEVPPQEVLDYLKEGFTQFLEGRVSSIDKALIPTKKSHRPSRLLTVIRDYGLARQVAALMSAGTTLEEATYEVANNTHDVLKPTIVQAYKKYRLYVSEKL